MKIKIGGREISLFEVKNKKKEVSHPLQWADEKKFHEFIEAEKQRTGRTDAEILEEIFRDGWLTVMVEETGTAKIDASQLYKETKTEESVEEYKRLRNSFGPISTCVDYLKDQILGGGVGAMITDAKDAHQKKTKEDIEDLINNIYQDEYLRSLDVILPILVDKTLVEGCSAAEITYEEDKTFWDFAKLSKESRIVKVDGKDTEVIIYDVKEPSWQNELKGVKRLKVFDDAYRRFDVQRDINTWEIKYWILDEAQDQPIALSSGIKIRLGTKVSGTYFHPWQVFWLVLRRKDYGVKGESVIKPAYSLAILLEKILNAVGQGIHRAGNKKYFIVCGTKERTWSAPHIRNVLQQLKEASQKNWSTIPMPEGFDVKEIGGEIFDAKAVVDYFLKVIAATMMVPAEALGIFVREQKKYSYKEYKINLMLAIKHQLFKHHIWCLYGKTRTKQGGKGTEPTYVPNPRFRTEDLLTFREKFDLLIGGLNAANPFHPLLKLKVESEFAKMMGWDDVLLPTQDEYKAELEEEQKIREREVSAKERTLTLKEKMGEKFQGEPEPQTEERQEKRLKGMTKKGEEKGKAREMGATRMPAEVKKS